MTAGAVLGFIGFIVMIVGRPADGGMTRRYWVRNALRAVLGGSEG